MNGQEKQYMVSSDLQGTLGNLVQHLGGSDAIRVDAQAHKSTEQLVYLFHHAKASVLLNLYSLQSHETNQGINHRVSYLYNGNDR
jgi:hypothetical protein